MTPHILITGATSGIGFATANRLLGQGMNVVAVGRNESRLSQFATRWNGQCIAVAWDLSDLATIAELCSQLPELGGVVLSAGIVRSNPIRYFDLDVFNKVLAINLISPILLCAELVKQGKLAPGASIALLSSINGTQVGIRGTLAYSTSKAGLSGAAKVLALELAPKGIRVNCVTPGMVDTEMTREISVLSTAAVEADKAKYPLGKRYATADEVASVLAFLISTESTFITGQNIVVDGGYCIQ